MGVKDIFEQTIIMTKDVIIGDENYQELYSNSKIARIYELSSNIHISENRDPEIHEVSTYIKPLK
jgi:DNA sulfur modification protein DndD